MAEAHWNHMFLEERPVVRVVKVWSKALSKEVEKKLRKSPDVLWKKDILNDAIIARTEKPREQQALVSEEDLEDGIDVNEDFEVNPDDFTIGNPDSDEDMYDDDDDGEI